MGKPRSLGLEKPGVRIVPVCVKMEAELAGLSDEEKKKEYLVSMGQETSGLDRLIVEAYAVLVSSPSSPDRRRRVHGRWWGAQGPSPPPSSIRTLRKASFAPGYRLEGFRRARRESAAGRRGLVRIEGKVCRARWGYVLFSREFPGRHSCEGGFCSSVIPDPLRQQGETRSFLLGPSPIPLRGNGIRDDSGVHGCVASLCRHASGEHVYASGLAGAYSFLAGQRNISRIRRVQWPAYVLLP